MSETSTDLQTGEEPVAPEPAPVFNPEDTLGARIRKNFFKDIPNSIITILFGLFFLWAAVLVFGFLFDNTKVNPEGEIVDAWRVVTQNLEIFMVGTRLDDTVAAGFLGDGPVQFNMIWSAIYLLSFTMGFAIGRPKGVEPRPMGLGTRIAIVGPVVVAALVLLLMTETFLPKLLTVLVPIPGLIGLRLPAMLPERVLQRKGLILFGLSILIFLIETGFNPFNVNEFGGLLLTVNTAFISIALCFPIGVIMALMRRSSFPLLRPVAVAYIELIRGVPLISLLFMGQFAIGFFFPPGFEQPPPVIRAIIMMTLFSGAYVAEIVRGGLQSVPAGQTEAGQAVGLSPVTITARIVLPQALRNSIPALVGQFIALLKDTTLLIIIGLFDLLGVSDPILANPEFTNQGYQPEVYAFVAFLFWVITFSMSRASQRLESNLGVGTR